MHFPESQAESTRHIHRTSGSMPSRHPRHYAGSSRRYWCITVMFWIGGLCHSAAFGQSSPVSANQIPPPPSLNFAPATPVNAPMFAQNRSVPEPNAQPSAESTPPAPPDTAGAEKKKEGETSGDAEKKEDTGPQCFNIHAQTTAVPQGDLPFAANYSGPNSLSSAGERELTFAADLFAGVRLWRGAEVHLDALMWEGLGLSDTFGIEGFPNGDAYKAGTTIPNFIVARLFIRQTFGLGGEQEDVADGQLTLAGKQDISRLTFTVGRFTPTDMFDINTYAHDSHTQFLNWAAQTAITWDYPSDTVGFTTGMAAEFNQPDWTLRYGFFQMPSVANGFTREDEFLCWPGDGSDGVFWKNWGMVSELERRWKIDHHPGAVRLMAWLNESTMASYNIATPLLLANPPPPDTPAGAEITIPAAAYADRFKYGFGLNWEQEISKDVGLFSRVGWNDGQEAAWTYTEVNWSASLGASVKGAKWNRPDDVVGLCGIVSGASAQQIQFLKAGGTGILNGDGNLTYRSEKAIEGYYDFPIGKGCRFAVDYQFIADPAFNADRGPVNVFAIRLHWEQ
jgi:high affinity Mn2+ porin